MVIRASSIEVAAVVPLILELCGCSVCIRDVNWNHKNIWCLKKSKSVPDFGLSGDIFLNDFRTGH